MSPLDYLKGADATAYLDYRFERAEAYAQGTAQWCRIAQAHGQLEPVQLPWVGIWEDPHEPDAPMKVTHPASHWIAALMEGGIIAPPDAKLSSRVLLVGKDGKSNVVDYVDVPLVKRQMGPLAGEWIVDYRRVHKETAPAMTMEQAMEACMQISIPRYVWGVKRNRPHFAIIKKDQLPSDRQFRSAWRMADFREMEAA